ncbi:glycosyltransferase [Azotosporobacter soli]|uniref:glycosyltransferase n=1 Tax=Azotosporobacter soli TaxID=3055040 RepID=UPI0031FF1F8A
MKNVLIISYHFPPINNIAARRYGYMVNHFEKNGWTPWVITTNSEGSLPQEIPEERVIRLGHHFQINEKIDHSKISKAANGIKGWPRLAHAVLRKLNFRLKAIDRYLFTWYKDVWKRRHEIKQMLPKIDLIVATFDPATALWLGRNFANFYNVPWIADYRDLAALHPVARSRFAQFIDVRIERKLLATASRLTTVSESLAGLLSSVHGKRCDVIYNGWDHGEWPQDCKEYLPIREIPQMPYLYYAGRFYEHQIDSVKLLMMVLKEVGNIALVIRSLGPSNIEIEINEFGKKIHVDHRVVMLSSCDYQTVYHEAQHAMANVIFEDLCMDDPWSKGTLTGKLFTLLPLRPPLICIARADSEMGRILDITQKGKLLYSVPEMIQYIESIAKLTAPESISNAVNQFSREVQAEKMVKMFNEVTEDKAQCEQFA